MRNRLFRYFVPFLALYLLSGVIYTLPLVKYFSTGIPYVRYAEEENPVHYNRHGDHLQLHYRFWLLKDSLVGNSTFFENKYEFNTGLEKLRPISCYFTPYSLIFVLFGFLGKGGGYNAAIISSYILSGFSMYLLVFYYTKDRFASLLAGLVFAIAPFRTMSALSGHPTGFSMSLLPLFIYSFEKMMFDKSIGHSFLGGFTFLILTDNDLHVLYLTALLVPFFLIRYLTRIGRKQFFSEFRKLILPVLPFIILLIAALVMKYFHTPIMSAEKFSAERSMREILDLSPNWPGDIFYRNNVYLSRYVYLGAAACLFVAIITLVNIVRSFSSEHNKKILLQMFFFLAILFVSYILAFGPKFPFNLPYNFLYKNLPKYSMIRQTVKLMIVSVFALSVCVGLAFAYLRKLLTGKKGLIISCAILALILADYFPRSKTGISILAKTNRAYEEVFRGKPDKRVINVPIWPGDSAWSSHYLFYATIYRTIMVNGYNPVTSEDYVQDVFVPLKSLNSGQIQAEQYELLRKMNVEYLIIHEEAFPPKVCLFPSQYALDNFKTSPYLEPVSSHPAITIFEILDEDSVKQDKAEFTPSIVGVVHEAEELGGGDIIDDEDASNGKALLLRAADKASTVIRKRTTPAGDFTLSTRVKSEGPSAFKISVFRSQDGSVMYSEHFDVDTDGSYKTVSMDFSLEESISVYHILETSDGADLTVDWFYMKFADMEDPLLSFEFDDIFHTGNVKEHTEASEGRAVFLTDTDPSGMATRGPYRLYEEGEYEITLSLLVDRKDTQSKGDIASVIISDNMKNIIVDEQKINTRDFQGPDSLENFTYRFRLLRPTFLNVNIRYFRQDIYLDKAVIKPIKGIGD